MAIAGWADPDPGEAARIWPLFAIFVLFVVMAVFAPLIAPFDPDAQNLLARLQPPGAEIGERRHLLGTDQLGRDLLSRIIHGARISLFVAALSTAVSALAGIWLGLAAGYYRGVAEAVIMRVVDIVLSIPPLLLAILIAAVLGPGFKNLILVLAFSRWPRYARVAHGQTLSVASAPYVKASQFIGVGAGRILWRHILPNIIAPLIVVATLEFGLMILFEAGLSFLGLGVQPPTPSWGSIISVGRNYMATAWWIATLPGVCLFLLVLSVNMIG
ncbi:MAG: ABC transporter permease, partial [Desulfobacterales bacterium]|nr:ABC transporter permease [Desulfobacterales bacterium]